VYNHPYTIIVVRCIIRCSIRNYCVNTWKFLLTLPIDIDGWPLNRTIMLYNTHTRGRGRTKPLISNYVFARVWGNHTICLDKIAGFTSWISSGLCRSSVFRISSRYFSWSIHWTRTWTVAPLIIIIICWIIVLSRDNTLHRFSSEPTTWTTPKSLSTSP